MWDFFRLVKIESLKLTIPVFSIVEKTPLEKTESFVYFFISVTVLAAKFLQRSDLIFDFL